MKFDLLKNIENGGCSAKLPAKELFAALKDLPKIDCKNLLVDIETHDDAGVYKISDEIALIQTVDFFPPVCSDPFEFGQIAAANALSDVFAMGGKVLTAMNLLMFPANQPIKSIKDILKGGQEKVAEAGGVLVGGHTISDNIPKYGLAVTGIVQPEKVIANSEAKPGDVLILTKPIGSGVVMAGKKIAEVIEKNYQAVLDSMKQLNKTEAEIMQKFHIKSATDITGFGLLGHTLKMAQASNVSIKINSASVPLFDEAYKLAEMGCIPSASFRNQEFVNPYCNFDKKVTYEQKMLLFDAQTSGGMLIAVPEKISQTVLKVLRESGKEHSEIIAEVIPKNEKEIYLV
ncbi:MAG: selenide, water dikinase SelD [Bacteroidetes bacterium]|nr:selenide, water dikinase SelD [Bacteroidota bacterium]